MKSKLPLIAGALLLAGAIVVVIQLRGGDPAAPASTVAIETKHPANSAPPASAEPAAAQALQNSTRDRARPVMDEELVAKYGESRTKLARHVSAGLGEVLGDVMAMGSSIAGFDTNNSSGSMPRQWRDLGDKLALNAEQSAKVSGIFKEHEKRALAKAGEAVQRMKDDPAPLMGLLLAGDAFKRGKIDKAQYDEIQAESKGIMESSLGILGNDDAGFGNPFTDESVLSELDTVMDPNQRETLQTYLQDRAAKPDAGSSNQGLGDAMALDLSQGMELEELDKQLTSTKKLTAGFKAILEGAGELGLDGPPKE